MFRFVQVLEIYVYSIASHARVGNAIAIQSNIVCDNKKIVEWSMTNLKKCYGTTMFTFNSRDKKTYHI